MHPRQRDCPRFFMTFGNSWNNAMLIGLMFNRTYCDTNKMFHWWLHFTVLNTGLEVRIK